MAKTVSRVRAAERAEKLNDDVAQSLRNSKNKDSFQNFALNLGIGTDNPLSGSTYGFNPVTRIRTLLEWIHRGSWLGGLAVDIVPDDMTRAKIEYNTTMEPDQVEEMVAAATRLNLWGSLNSALKWGRLYGGAILVMLIDGQDVSTQLRLNSIRKDQLKGFLVLDRWMVEPSLNKLIADYGPHMGLPAYYRVTSNAPGLAGQNIHHSRVLRIEGLELPYWQKLNENLWGLSIIERLYDRMVAFDSATTGASQLVYKSFLRTMKMKGLREAAIAGGDALIGVSAQVQMMRRYQSIEGVTLIDGDDEFQVDGATSFSGIAEALGQFGQQISGALQIPLVRLFGQSPTGFNSGDSDVRTYYDGIKHQQEQYRVPITTILTVMAKSEGIPLPEKFGFEFKSLWQLDDIQKAEVATKVGAVVDQAVGSGTIGRKTALKELRQSSRITGVFTNITDKDIDQAEEDPPDPSELMGLGAGPSGAGSKSGSGGETEKLNSEPSAGKPAANGSESGAKDRRRTKDRARLLDVYGLPVRIETGRGEIREGTDARGKRWMSIMMADYGYFEGTGSAEGAFEGMDCFVGSDEDCRFVYVIDQRDLDTGAFDEHKCMMWFISAGEAEKAYCESFHDGRAAERIMGMKSMTPEAFKAWLKAGPLDKPLG